MGRGGKFFLGFFVYSTTILILVFTGGVWLTAHAFMKPGPLADTVLVDIPPGTGLNRITALLQEAHVLDEPLAFKAGTWILGAQRSLKAGEYEFTPGISAKAVMLKLEKGETVGRRFTAREGLTSYEIVNIIKAVEELNGDVKAIPAEGALLPETYDYRRGEDRQAVLARLEQAMISSLLELCKITEEEEDGGNPVPSFAGILEEPCGADPLKTVHDVLTLASIVEKETGISEERKRVAGVFINRLKRGIPLQTDPTVIYALTKGQHKNDGKGPLGRRLLSKDLAYDSPYNTYLYPGLPPGPIANPGRAAIEAVLAPEDHDYIFFVADGTGGHVFSKTLAEHNRNVAKWRKIRQEQK